MGVFRRLDHVAIGVEDLKKAEKLFCDILGGERTSDQFENPYEGFQGLSFRLGGGKVELVAPVKKGEGGVGRYIAKHGEGFHHLSIGVDDLRKAKDYFESKGLRILGANFESSYFKHFYLHPKDTFGALIQVFEDSKRRRQYEEQS